MDEGDARRQAPRQRSPGQHGDGDERNPGSCDPPAPSTPAPRARTRRFPGDSGQDQPRRGAGVHQQLKSVSGLARADRSRSRLARSLGTEPQHCANLRLEQSKDHQATSVPARLPVGPDRPPVDRGRADDPGRANLGLEMAGSGVVVAPEQLEGDAVGVLQPQDGAVLGGDWRRVLTSRSVITDIQGARRSRSRVNGRWVPSRLRGFSQVRALYWTAWEQPRSSWSTTRSTSETWSRRRCASPASSRTPRRTASGRWRRCRPTPPTWSSSTSACPASTASRSAGACGPTATTRR